MLAAKNDVSVSGQALDLLKGILFEGSETGNLLLVKFIEEEMQGFLEILMYLIDCDNFLAKVEGLKVRFISFYLIDDEKSCVEA